MNPSPLEKLKAKESTEKLMHKRRHTKSTTKLMIRISKEYFKLIPKNKTHGTNKNQ
jgi:hypothetical protein